MLAHHVRCGSHREVATFTQTEFPRRKETIHTLSCANLMKRGFKYPARQRSFPACFSCSVVNGYAVEAAAFLLAMCIVQKMTQEVSFKEDEAVACKAAVQAATSQAQNLANNYRSIRRLRTKPTQATIGGGSA